MFMDNGPNCVYINTNYYYQLQIQLPIFCMRSMFFVVLLVDGRPERDISSSDFLFPRKRANQVYTHFHVIKSHPYTCTNISWFLSSFYSVLSRTQYKIDDLWIFDPHGSAYCLEMNATLP